jgi:hypothetical protein
MDAVSVLRAALPYAMALVKLIELATKFENREISEDEVREEIARIDAWAKDAEAKDLALFGR